MFSRDLVDLAMTRPQRPVLEAGLAKAVGAYGARIQSRLDNVVAQFR